MVEYKKGMSAKDIVKLSPEEIEEKWATADYHRYKPKSHTAVEAEWLAPTTSTPEDLYLMEEQEDEKDEFLEELKEHIASLTERQQQVVQLLYYEDLSFKEVAEKMNINVSRVYQLQRQALKSLAKLRDKNKDLCDINELNL